MFNDNIIINGKDSAYTADQISIGGVTISEKINAGPQRTKITLVNHDTGEILGEYQNKCVITGSVLNATNAFGVKPPIKIPTYNTDMILDNSKESEVTPYNTPIVCLFSVGDDGCGATPKDVYTVNFKDRIAPAPPSPSIASDFDSTHIMPFRWVAPDQDLNSDLRKFYFGRKTFERLNRIGYYFKVFDTRPQCHLRYADGTQISDTIYYDTTDQMAECYIETRLRITRLDFRDYFEEILGWDKARISSISLNYAWYDDTIDEYKWYQDIYPYTKLNFPYQWMVDLNMAIDVIYQIYY